MKTILLVLSLVTTAAVCPAQTGRPPAASATVEAKPATPRVARTYQLGTQSVVIPEPDGFEEATSQFDGVQTAFTATEVPTNEMLAVHTSPEDTARLRKGDFSGLDFYTKVSISRRLKSTNTTPENFREFVAAFRAEGGRMLDPNGQEMKKFLQQLEVSLSDLGGSKVSVDLSQQKNLGEIYSTPNAFSTLLLADLKIQDEQGSNAALMLCGASVVRVKQRLLFVYTYKKFRTAADADALRAFTKRWLDQIVAANGR